MSSISFCRYDNCFELSWISWVEILDIFFFPVHLSQYKISWNASHCPVDQANFSAEMFLGDKSSKALF